MSQVGGSGKTHSTRSSAYKTRSGYDNHVWNFWCIFLFFAI